MQGRNIKSISFLTKDGSRKRISVDSLGRFAGDSVDKFLEKNVVKFGDPYFTLFDGDKIRVFYGGDSRQFSAQAHGILENHLKHYASNLKNKKSKKSVITLGPPKTLGIFDFDWNNWD